MQVRRASVDSAAAELSTYGQHVCTAPMGMRLLAIPILLVLVLAGMINGASGSALGWLMAMAGVFGTALLLDPAPSHASHEPDGAGDHASV